MPCILQSFTTALVFSRIADVSTIAMLASIVASSDAGGFFRLARQMLENENK